MKKKPKRKRHSRRRRLALGIDDSTQSIKAVLLDIRTCEIVWERQLDFLTDPRLAGFGVTKDYIVPPRVEGEADQPLELHIAALDALMADMANDMGAAVGDIVVANVSAQQHGFGTLLKRAARRLRELRLVSSGPSKSLCERLKGSFAYGVAPIWKTSNTAAQADHIRKAVGGKGWVIELMGSDAPLRFTGPIIRRLGEQFPEVYEATHRFHLLSSLLTAILCGSSVPIGDGAGTGLMQYRTRRWSEKLIAATADGLPGGAAALKKKLPRLAAPNAIAGTIANYFVDLGFSPECYVCVGSGDNPQARVLTPGEGRGDLLSFGTSMVEMESDGTVRVDPNGLANSMYDGVGRPFVFSCRTNSMLCLDAVRAEYGLGKKQFAPAERALRSVDPGGPVVLWQPDAESFPPSRSFALRRFPASTSATLKIDYAGVVESNLTAMWVYSRRYKSSQNNKPLYVTGGGANSPGILRRVSAIWKRDVIAINNAGPALGAAVAGAQAYCQQKGLAFDLESVVCQLAMRDDDESKAPRNGDDIARFHAPGGYIERFKKAYERFV